MKKRLTVVVALTLALVLLCGCSLTDSALGNSIGGKLAQFAQRTSEHNPDGLKFSDMRYYRPDTEKLAADVAAVEEALDSGARLKAVEDLLDVCMDDYDEFDTMYALANIYNCKDLRDEYYALRRFIPRRRSGGRLFLGGLLRGLRRSGRFVL